VAKHLSKTLALAGFLVALLIPAGALADPQPALDPAPADFDRSTPRRAMQSYLVAERAGDSASSRYALELSHLSAQAQREESEELAEELKKVLDRVLWVELDDIPNEPADHAGARIEVGKLPLEGEVEVPLVLESVRDRDGELVWVISGSVVTRIPELFAVHGPGWVETLFPEWMGQVRVWELELWQLVSLALALILAVVIGRVLAAAFLRMGASVAGHTATKWDDSLVKTLRGPTRFLIAVISAWLLAEPIRLAAPVQQILDHALQIALVGALAWLVVRLVRSVSDLIITRAEEEAAEEEDAPNAELRLRGLRTQVLVLRRVISIIVGILTAALVLVQFEVVRSVGLSLLASAGMAGIVIGLAAQRSIATLLAGIQLSITQPIRLGDTVIVEGEWGTIEEINLTYVVVKVWDERRLVVPMSRFLEQAFQNWTKVSPELLGTIYFHADYTLPMAAAREALDEIVTDHPKWDGRAKGLLVTDVKDRTLEVRALISAKDAGDQWDLRCVVREKMIAWLAEYEGGKYLPRVRLEDEASGAAT
jgi:small-conductance mechanosensitive channel